MEWKLIKLITMKVHASLEKDMEPIGETVC
jgi:hypothetical protein